MIDGILVVNLDQRPERWEQFLEDAGNWEAACGVAPERLSAVLGVELTGYDQSPWFRSRMKERRKQSWAGKAGCTLSHRAAIAQAHKNGWKTVLIVEDDATLSAEAAVGLKNILQESVPNLPADWVAIYGYTANPFGPFREVALQGEYRLIEMSGALGTVAYILNVERAAGLFRTLPEEQDIWKWVARHKAIDLWFSKNLSRFGKVYVITPSIVDHRVGPSDITVTPESECAGKGILEELISQSARDANDNHEEALFCCCL